MEAAGVEPASEIAVSKRVSMRSRVPKISLRVLRTDKMHTPASPINLILAART